MANFIVKDPRDIKRTPLVHKDDVEAELRADTLERAHKLLGYTADSFGSQGPLAGALMELAIAPLDASEVEAYMQSKKRKWKTNRRMLGGWMFWMVVPCAVWCLLVWHGAAAGWFKASEYISFEETLSVVLLPITLGCALLSVVLGGCVWGCALADRIKDYTYETYWAWHTLGHRDKFPGTQDWMLVYKKYVPVHLLNLAVQVKEAAPKATFYVLELTLSKDEAHLPQPDPFLFVHLGSERYAIGVWDEREFEAGA